MIRIPRRLTAVLHQAFVPPLGDHLCCLQAQHRPDADLKLPRNSADAFSGGEGRLDCPCLVRVSVLDPSAPKALALCLRSRQSSHDPLPNHRAFELGEYPHHLEHRPTPGRRGVEALLVEEKVNALGMQLAQQVE